VNLCPNCFSTASKRGLEGSHFSFSSNISFSCRGTGFDAFTIVSTTRVISPASQAVFFPLGKMIRFLFACFSIADCAGVSKYFLAFV
jgi:hypothetical protein